MLFKAIISGATLFIIYKLFQMGEQLNQIKTDLQAANAKADKIQADVTYLTSQIGNVEGETPTAEEWAEVKQIAADLNSKLQGIDDQTTDQGPTPEPEPTPNPEQ